jgi:periplasmic mercuric ion binding protein
LNKRQLCILTLSLALLSASAWTTSKTVTLNVPGMTCPPCPVTVKKALNRIDGVSKIEVRYEKKLASVTFDDAKTNTQALIKATTDAGFPSEEQK